MEEIGVDVNECVRMVSCLLMGGYRDGSYYLLKLSPLKSLNWSWRYFLTPSLSENLMRFNIESYVDSTFSLYHALYDSRIKSGEKIISKQ